MYIIKRILTQTQIIEHKEANWAARWRMLIEYLRELDRTAEHRNAADLSAIELLWYAYDHGSFATTDKTKKWYEDVEAVLKAADGG